MAALGAAVVAVWLYLLFGRGGFWRMREEPAANVCRPSPAITAVIPARNEADVVGRAVASLAKQNYGGGFRIVVIDDASSDGTPEAARSAAPGDRLTVIGAAPLPAGWTGKLWAVNEGVRHAARFAPDYLLLTDADIVHPPGNVAELVARAESGGYDLVSFMATLRAETEAERALIPAFVFFFFLLYPPAWIRDPRSRTAGAAGGCMLIRRAALERIGGIAAISGALIDDCALADAVKRSGGNVWLGLSSGTRSIRGYDTWGAVGRMISRSAFTQLRHSALLLAGTVFGMAFTYLLPVWLALAGRGYAQLFGACSWLLMSVAYFPALRFYRLSPLRAPLLPLVAAFYTGATLHSAIAYWRGAGGRWKGRVQDARER